MNATHLATLCNMLEYRRPHGSIAEGIFRRRYLMDLPGLTEDAHGNLIVKIGTSPILWSSHTDTVHRSQGVQSLRVNEREHTIRLSRRSKRTSNCLGADDTVGVFLMREMILRGVAGTYIFHYGEESGGIGSSAIRDRDPSTLSHVLYAIALDRHGTSDVITHQFGGRTASDVFARSLASQLPGHYAPTQGIFTDTANYAELIPECTNVSVGYYHEHRETEYVDYAHVGILLEALCEVNADQLTCARDPYAPDPDILYYQTKRDRTHRGRFDSRFDVPLWRDAPSAYLNQLADYDDREICPVCQFVILDPSDDYPLLDDFCTCEGEYTEEDLKFLRYLKGV